MQNYQNNFKNVALIGRTYILDEKIYFNFSGSGFKFSFNGNKLKIVLNANNFKNENSNPYVSIFIDNQRKDYCLEEGINEIVYNVSDSYHKVMVIKRTESAESYVALEKIEGNNIKPLKLNPLKIEFYGDSITCGFGVLLSNHLDSSVTITESFTDSYAFITANNLNAQYSTVCVSGFPIYKGRWNEGFPIESISEMVSICDYNEKMTKKDVILWDNTKYIPDIVIINLGTNDSSYFTKGERWIDELINTLGSYELVKESFDYQQQLNNLYNKIIKFLDDLFRKYPKTKIIWTTGMLTIEKDVEEVIDKAVNDYPNNNLYRFKFTTLQKSHTFGSFFHPGLEMHKLASIELTEFINKIIK